MAFYMKLSLPTVSHHVRELRILGVIRLEMGGKGRETRYGARWPIVRRRSSVPRLMPAGPM